MDHNDIATSSLPLGAQQSQSNNNDDEEAQHFEQVIQSYQQYATFHQTRQRGVNRRLINLLLCDEPANTNTKAASTTSTSVHHHPTLQSILPPSLQPAGNNNSTAPEYLQYQKDFSAATIRNQYFLDNVLKYSNQETSQDVLRRWRSSRQYQQQHHHQQNQQRIFSSTDDGGDDDDGQQILKNDTGTSIEWTTEDRISKIDSVLKSVARDWSADGQEERSAVYNKMIGALERYLPLSSRRDSTCDHQHQNRFADHGSDGDIDTNSRTNEDQELVDIDDSHATIATATTISTTPRVAVPGSGLGRLAWEIYSRGYSVQGSDFSLPMLLASDFILNGCGGGTEREDGDGGGRNSFQQFRIIPWLAETKNVLSFRDRIRTVIVPDVDPTSIDHSNYLDDECELPEFTMLAGEFLHLYSHHLPGKERMQHHPSRHHHHPESSKKFHAVVCSFFIDTAPSLPHYLLTIYHMLEEGGLFVHCGPLMYHWSGHGGLLPGDDDIGSSNSISGNGNTYQERNKHLDSRYLTSIDYTWEEVRYMIVKCGFDILEEEMHIPAYYTMDGRSMMKVGYDCVYCVARKVNR